MYEQFYGFKEKPFNNTPDPKFFFSSFKHAEALNSLIYAIEERKGFVVITGEIGAGKTTITRAFLNQIDMNTKVALITNTHLNPKELICAILEELDVEYKPGGKQKLLSQLNDYLIKQLAADVNVVLIIDEAQNLSLRVLEEVRMLSNLETETEKLIQIILMGQPQLKKKLNDPKLEQFKQRIALYYHLKSLDRNETQNYIIHRLKMVSSNGTEYFSPEAIDLLYKHSKGVPRLINLVCDSALLSGYTYDTKQITEKIINEVIRERDINVQEESEIENELLRCEDCSSFSICQTKWLRDSKGEKQFYCQQICCKNCLNYSICFNGIAPQLIRRKNGKNY